MPNPPAALDPRRLRRPVRWAVAAIAITLGLLGVASRWVRLEGERLVESDFTQDYVSARAWSDGADPYAPTHDLVDRYLGRDVRFTSLPPGTRNPHPPAYIVMVRPFAEAPYRPARILWLLGTAGILALGVGMVARALGWGRVTAAIMGVGALVLPPSQKDLGFGQINGLLLVLLALAWLDLRRGSDARAGTALGIATALKLFPVFLLIPLLRLRRFRAAAWHAAVAVAVTAAGALAIGADATGRYLSEAAPENLRFWRETPENISLVAVPFRWLTASRWRPDAVELPWLALALAVAAAALCIDALSRTRARASGDWFWSAAPWMILASPLAWDHYLVLAYPLLLTHAVTAAVRRRFPSPVLLCAVGAMLLGTPFEVRNAASQIPDVAQATFLALPLYGLLVFGLADWAPRVPWRRGTRAGREAHH